MGNDRLKLWEFTEMYRIESFRIRFDEEDIILSVR